MDLMRGPARTAERAGLGHLCLCKIRPPEYPSLIGLPRSVFADSLFTGASIKTNPVKAGDAQATAYVKCGMRNAECGLSLFQSEIRIPKSAIGRVAGSPKSPL